MSKQYERLKAQLKTLEKEKEKLLSKIASLEKANKKTTQRKTSIFKWIGNIFIGRGLKIS